MRPHRTLFATAAALLGLAAVVSAAGAAPLPLDASTRDFDQTHLVLKVTPDVAAGRVDVETTIRFLPLVEGLSTLRLHSVETDVLSATDGAGAPLVWKAADGVLSVSLGKALKKGAESSVVLRTRSAPKRGLYFHAPSKDSPNTPLEMYSQGQGTDNRRWFPVYDEPDDRMTVEVLVTVPDDLTTVSNGTKVASRALEGGRREDHWRLEQRIPSYLVTLIVGRYEKVEETCGRVPLEYLGPPGRAAEIKTGCGGTPAMMRFFEEFTARAYPYPRYAQTCVWDFVYGGMENASATTMNMRLLHGEDAVPNYSPDGLVAHELAHQWFGDLLTCRTWDHIWLNEGFATYFTDLFFEHRDGPAEFALHRFRQNRGYMEGTKDPAALGLERNPRGDVPLELFGGKQYDRGAAILHQLRIELGDEAFRDGIRRYVKDHEDRAVVSEDLRRSMEAATGRDLEWFFDQWVYGAGYPTVTVKPAAWMAAAGPTDEFDARLEWVVEQTQREGSGQTDAFRLSIPWRVGANGPKGVLDLRRRRQTLRIPFRGRGSEVYLRMNDGGAALARVRVEQGLREWVAMLSDPDPTGRIEAAEALAEWPEDAAEPLAKAIAKDEVHAVRVAAAKTLGGVPGKASLDALLAALADPDARVREAVAEALGGRSRAEVAKPLAAALDADPNSYVRAAAARALGRMHAEGAFERLEALLAVESHRETVRAAAFDGMKALGDPRAIPLARKHTFYDWKKGDHHGMRRAAIDLLLALAPDDPETHADVVRLLSDENHRMRGWAAEAAGTFRVRAAKPRLEALAASDPDGGVQAAAKKALERLAK
jgi:aminopeptidase N